MHIESVPKTTETIRQQMVCVKLREKIVFIEYYNVPGTKMDGDALFRLSHLSLPTELQMSFQM